MFRHAKVRFETNDIDTGDKILLWGILAKDTSIGGSHASPSAHTDSQSGDDDFGMNAGSPVSTERYVVATGPVTIHGYSVRGFSNCFGALYQGLSRYDGSLLSVEKNGQQTHQWKTGMSLNTTDTAGLAYEDTIKNHKYLRGWSAQQVVKDDGTFWNPLDSEASGVGISQHFGSAHLQKKFSRSKLVKSGKKWDKIKKSGFVLVPNTSTEFLTLNFAHILPQDLNDRNGYFDVNVWYSFDQG
jgi:hypothetical protein